MTWTDKRVEDLKKDWATGFSASQIATRLGGTTRNAVISKIHRLGLAGRQTLIRKAINRIKHARPKFNRAKKQRFAFGKGSPVLPYHEDTMAGVSAITDGMLWKALPGSTPRDLVDEALKNNHCRWPIGEAPFKFCGCDVHPGTSYCPTHAARAFAPPTTKLKDPSPMRTSAPGLGQITTVQEALQDA